MKKLCVFLSVCVVLLSLTACGAESEPVLKVYSAGRYIDMSVIEDFEKEYHCRVVYDEFDSNESMYIQVANNSYTYDVVVPSDYYIDRLKQEGRLEELDKSLIPNMENIYEEYLNPSYDSGNVYSVPYMVGTLGILYDKSRLSIDESDISYEMLFDPKYDGQIFMLDSVRDALAAALISLGYSANTENDAELTAAKELLISQKPIVQAYITDEMADKMIAGEGLMTLAYSGEAAYAMSESENLSYAVPKEGSNRWSDAFVVLKTGKQKELAMKYINFMCRTDISQRNMDETGYASPVKGTVADDETGTEVYYAKPETLLKCETFEYSKEVTDKYYDIWTELKVSG